MILIHKLVFICQQESKIEAKLYSLARYIKTNQRFVWFKDYTEFRVLL